VTEYIDSDEIFGIKDRVAALCRPEGMTKEKWRLMTVESKIHLIAELVFIADRYVGRLDQNGPKP
jgi:hypothetical protein